MDVMLYGQLYNEAMMGMDSFFEEMKDSMANFSKKRYPSYFEDLQKKYGKVLLSVEEIYNEEEDKEAWLNKLGERLVNHAKELVASKKWKFQRENLQIDCNMFVVSYIIPLILEYKGISSEAFAQAVANNWDKAFGTQMICGNYERIFGGFKTAILGIPFGK